MSIKVTWDDNDKLAIRYDFNGVWDWIEFAWANTRAFSMMNTVSHEVSIILNLKNGVDMPIGAMSAIQQMLSLAPHNLGVIFATHCDRQAAYTFDMLRKFDSTLAGLITLEKDVDTARKSIWHYWTVMVG